MHLLLGDASIYQATETHGPQWPVEGIAKLSDPIGSPYYACFSPT